MTIKFHDLGSFQDAYLDYLEGERDEPPKPEHLPPEHRPDAEAFVKSITAARGIDPYASRPSIEQLMASRNVVADPTEMLGEALQDYLRATVDTNALVTADSASITAELGSVLLIQARGLRMRAVPETGSADLGETIGGRTEDIANVFDAFPDCHAVLYTTTSQEPLGVVLDRADAYEALETPSGQPQPPRLPRTPAPATSACETWLRQLIPDFQPVTPGLLGRSVLRDPGLDTRHFARQALAEVSAAGRRARIDAKRATWTVFGDELAPHLVEILDQAQTGSLPVDAYESRIKRLAAQAR